MPIQNRWRFCRKCNGMFYNGYPSNKGVCKGGGGHEAQGYEFLLPHDVPEDAHNQGAWRYCAKCFKMFFDGYPNKGICAAGGQHSAQGYMFVLPHDLPANPGTTQPEWRFCGKCSGMFYNGFQNKGLCPGGGPHDAIGFVFVLPHGAIQEPTPPVVVPPVPIPSPPVVVPSPRPIQNRWRFCRQCNGMFYDGVQSNKGVCKGGGGHEAQGYEFLLPYDSQEDAHNQVAWRYCGKCSNMFYDGYPTKGICAAGGPHSAQGYTFALPHDLPTSPDTQPEWRFCVKCSGMFYNGYSNKGLCPGGGPHDAQGFMFVLPHGSIPPAQDPWYDNENNQKYWRYCDKCHCMFFDGFDSKGACAAGGGHQAQGFMFILPHDIPGTANDQNAWRFCHKCMNMFYDGSASKGRCSAGDSHQAAGFDFVLPHDLPPTHLAQDAWRYCGKCQSMFFEGFPEKGVCAGGDKHEAQGYMFVLPHDIKDPFVFSKRIVTGGAAALGGWIAITVNLNGTVRWQGHMRNSGADNYDYAISAVVATPSGRKVALAHKGYVGGTFSPHDKNDNWDETITLPGAVSARMSEFAHATLSTHLEYESGIVSIMESLASWLVKDALGTMLGPIGSVAFHGILAGSLIDSGSLVPGARLASGTLWMAGPSNMLFAIAAEGIASLGSRTRELRQEEYDWANSKVFLGALPPRDRLVLTDTIGGGNRAFTFPRWDGKITINMGPTAFDDPRRYQGTTDGRTFIHELVHACQIDHEAIELSLLADALGSRLCELGDGEPYAYGPAGPDYTSFNLEQQAQIVSDWFAGNSKFSSANHTHVPMDINSPYFPYITDNVRVGKF